MRTTERDDTGSMVGRVGILFDAFTPDTDILGISELSRRTGLAKSTVSRIVGELVEHHFLERADDGVRLGLRLFELGESATRPRDLRRIATATMADLRMAVRLTIHLAVLEGNEVVYIEILPARDRPPLGSRVGGRMPAHATGVGKALLAWSDPVTLDGLIDGGLAKVGPNSITDPAVLRRELAKVRDEGVAYEREESSRGVACAASAIRGPSGEAIASMSAAGWVRDFDVQRVGLAVQTAALTVSRLVARRPGVLLGSFRPTERYRPHPPDPS